MLTGHEITLIVIIVGMLVFIAFSSIPTEILAILILLILNFSGLIDSQEALSGFSSSVVVTLMGLFVITRTLEDVGIIQWIALRLNKMGGKSEVRLIILFMGAGAMLSLVMNNVAAGAVLLPAAVRVAQISGVRPSKLLIPVSFGTLVGGMATYLTTANIVMSRLLEDRDLESLNMLDFIPTGGLIVIAGLAFMILIGRHFLPERESLLQSIQKTDLPQTYQLDERMWVLNVLPQATLVNQSLEASGIGEKLGLTLLGIWRGRAMITQLDQNHSIHQGDRLLILGRQDRVELLLDWGLELLEGETSKRIQQNYIYDLTEVIIPPRSNVIDQTLTQLRFHQLMGLWAIALWREGRSYRTDVGKMPLKVGDALLVTGYPNRVQQLAKDVNYLIPQTGYTSHVLKPRQAGIALLITTIVLMIAIFEWLPLPQIMLSGAVAMVLTGCLETQEFFKAIEWRVIFLIAGMLPLSLAMSETGLAGRIGNGLVELLADASPTILIAGMFALTVMVTQVIGGQVSALLVGPIAIDAALQLGINPQAMAVTVAIACSTAFLTPIAHPVNILMMGPGGYKFADFFKVGLGMTLVTGATLLLGMAIFWGIY